MWYKDWALLTAEEREHFSRIINILLAKTFILRDRLEHREKSLAADRDFRFIERQYHLFRDYLAVAGWELTLETDYGVAWVSNPAGFSRRKLDKVTTYFLYVLRLIYEEEREKLSIRKEVITTVIEVVQKLGYLGLIDRRITDTLLADSFAILKDFNIIDKLDGSWTDPEARILIYPTILFVISNERINFLYRNLCGENGAGDHAGNGKTQKGEQGD